MSTLVTDRDLLLVLLQAQAATDEPAIREAVREGFARVHELVKRESDATPDEIQAFLAIGMLINVLASIGGFDDDRPEWAGGCLPRSDGTVRFSFPRRVSE